MPTVPAGFTVTTYAELQAPRMMVYAPNGDLFVSSPGANTIVVLRDANNDGTFEACSVFAAGDRSGCRRGDVGGAATTAAGCSAGCSGPLTNPNVPPAPAAAPAAAPRPAAAATGEQRRCGLVDGARRSARRRGARAPAAAAGGGGAAGSAGARRQRARVHAAAGVRAERARANFARPSASRSMTAISTSATPPRSFATSTRTAI